MCLCLSVCICSTCVQLTEDVSRKHPSSGTELQVVVSQHVGAEGGTLQSHLTGFNTVTFIPPALKENGMHWISWVFK